MRNNAKQMLRDSMEHLLPPERTMGYWSINSVSESGSCYRVMYHGQLYVDRFSLATAIIIRGMPSGTYLSGIRTVTCHMRDILEERTTRNC